jgi:transcriptional regulator with XRE-family HTH domain
MSTTTDPVRTPSAGIPELTALGRQLEMLRLDRGLSKQGLARGAGTSRQQLWRVMTGKSELTTSLCQRLAEVLGVDARALRDPDAFGRTIGGLALAAAEDGAAIAGRAGRVIRNQWSAAAPSVAEYLADPRWIARTLATCPGGNEGRLLKRRLLDGLEDAAREAGVKLPPSFFTVRGRVVNGEL